MVTAEENAVHNADYDYRKIPHCRELFGMMDLAEGEALWRYAKECRQSIIEIGTYCGYSTLFLGCGIRNRPQEFQQNVQIFTVDTHRSLSPKHREASAEMVEKRERGHVCTFRQMTRNCKNYKIWDLISPIIDDSAHAWKHGVDLPCDMLFIDGDHDKALRDYQNWSPLVEAHSIVCFHDYCDAYPQVIADVDALVAEGKIEKLALVKTLFISRRIG